ncbi:hypothetical protein F5Y17DRAFT_457724 [Xylariaceae sp. FL0594]|nr:hypothetical protein F5Y17DRAFT_457724 [Xylariaceae sp. FL0594]
MSPFFLLAADNRATANMEAAASSKGSTSTQSSASISDANTRRPSNVMMHPPKPKRKTKHSTDPYLRDFTLVAEAARRAQIDLMMRDLENANISVPSRMSSATDGHGKMQHWAAKIHITPTHNDVILMACILLIHNLRDKTYMIVPFQNGDAEILFETRDTMRPSSRELEQETEIGSGIGTSPDLIRAGD